MSYLTQMLRAVNIALPSRLCVLSRPRPPLAGVVGCVGVGGGVGCGQQRGMAGHSKWANIRHTKALKDGQKQKIVTKCIQMIKMAIKEGGGVDPKLNSELARVIDFARSQNMAATTIANTLKQSQKSQDNAKSMMLEYRGPGGLLLLAEVFTDNLVKTRSNIQSVIKKTSFQEVRGGGMTHLFDEKGVVVTAAREGTKMPSLEEALELAIEIGAEEVEEAEEGRYVFTSSRDAFLEVKKGVEAQGYEVVYSSVDFIPHTAITLSQEDMQWLDTVLEKIEAVDEVTRLHVNL